MSIKPKQPLHASSVAAAATVTSQEKEDLDPVANSSRHSTANTSSCVASDCDNHSEDGSSSTASDRTSDASMRLHNKRQIHGFGDDEIKSKLWMQWAWVVHFVIGTLVLVYSVAFANGGKRKYIPVDPSEMEGLFPNGCRKVFVNVLAESRLEPDAIVCCPFFDEDDDDDRLAAADSLLGLCPSAISENGAYPFLGRLAKFPDAWLIPLFPLLLRIAFRTYQTVLENGHLIVDTTFGVYSFRRLCFYFLVMQFRGWVLYVALNSIEDNFMAGPRDTSGCWYGSWLQDGQPSCYGRRFDFSDHVVLYYAQLLPIALMEYLHSINRPYWPFHCFRRVALPAILTMGMLYLYFITFVGVFKTAAYFHTPGECLAGFAVSLLLQLPLCGLQCSNARPRLMGLREFFFGPKTKLLLH